MSDKGQNVRLAWVPSSSLIRKTRSLPPLSVSLYVFLLSMPVYQGNKKLTLSRHLAFVFIDTIGFSIMLPSTVGFPIVWRPSWRTCLIIPLVFLCATLYSFFLIVVPFFFNPYIQHWMWGRRSIKAQLFLAAKIGGWNLAVSLSVIQLSRWGSGSFMS